MLIFVIYAKLVSCACIKYFYLIIFALSLSYSSFYVAKLRLITETYQKLM